MSGAASSEMDLPPGSDRVENMEISTKTDSLGYATTDFLQQQASEVITIHIIDDNMSNVESSATDSNVTNDEVENTINTKNLNDAAMASDRTDMIAQVTIVQTENNKYWECDICQKMFFWKCHLVRHKVIHVEKQYKCEVCDKNYSKQQTLKVHMRTHTGEKPYMCAQCGKTFTDRARFNNHQWIHTGMRHYYHERRKKTEKFWQKQNLDGKSYQCSICLADFSTTAAVNSHKKRAHFGELDRRHFVADKFPCSICKRKFGYLEHHMAVKHPDSKAETCSTCNIVFPTKRHLEKHILSHVEKEKFKCDVCGEIFRTHYKLTKHKAWHVIPTKTKIPCTECGKHFDLHLPALPQTILKCENCKSRKKTRSCENCNLTNIQENHSCISYQKRKIKKHKLQLQKCGKVIKNGDVYESSRPNRENSKSKKIIKNCDNCNLTNIQKNHSCRTVQKTQMKKRNLQFKKTKRLIENEDVSESSRSNREKFTVNLNELSDSLKISCNICKRKFLSGQFHATGQHSCGILHKIEKMCEYFSNPANNLESSGLNTAAGHHSLETSQPIDPADGSSQRNSMSRSQTGLVEMKMSSIIWKESSDDNTKILNKCGNIDSPPVCSPQALSTNSRCQKVIEITEKENTDDLDSAIEHLENIIYNETIEKQYGKNDNYEIDLKTMILTKAPEPLLSKNITSKSENSIMSEIVHIKEEIDDS